MDLCLVLILLDIFKQQIMKQYINTLIIIIVILTLVSCYNDIGPIEPDMSGADILFTNDVQPIFTQNCIQCHTSYDSLNLTEGNSYNEIVNMNSYSYDGLLVTPNEPDNSVLFNKINNSNNYGANMPLGDFLSANEIAIIKQWIIEGAKNN